MNCSTRSRETTSQRENPAARSHVRLDRGLVSQAILHGMTIAAPDAELVRYPAPILW